MRFSRFLPLFALLLMGFAPQDAATPTAQTPERPAAPPKLTPRVRPRATVRLGGVYTLGLSSSDQPLEESAELGKPLSDDNARWIANNCDVIALNAVNITPNTFPPMRAA